MADDAEAGFENPEVNARAIIAFTFGFLVFVAVSLVLLGFYYGHANVSAAPAPPRDFPAPQLETRNGQDLSAIRDIQSGRSLDYSWVDREHGLVRIPIARAMEIVAARGSKAYDPPDALAAPASGAP
jgi:hypothetical protein